MCRGLIKKQSWGKDGRILTANQNHKKSGETNMVLLSYTGYNTRLKHSKAKHPKRPPIFEPGTGRSTHTTSSTPEAQDSKSRAMRFHRLPASPAAMGLAALKIKRSPRNCSCTWQEIPWMAPARNNHPLHCFKKGLRPWRLEGKNDWSNNRGATHHTCKKPWLHGNRAVSKCKGEQVWMIIIDPDPPRDQTNQTKTHERTSWQQLSIGQSCFLCKSMLIQRIPRQRIQTQNLHMEAQCQNRCSSKIIRCRFHKEQVKDLMWKNKLQIVCRIKFCSSRFCWPFGTTP